MGHKEWSLFIILFFLIMASIIFKVVHCIELSNINDNNSNTTLKEEQFDREYIDISKLSKKVLKKITIINDIVYEKVTDKDKKNNNVLISVNDTDDKKLKVPTKGHNYEDDEVSDKDLIIPSKIKVKVK